MDTQTNIRTLDSSIFLKEGAFVRWKGLWHTFCGPFESVETDNNPVFSISCQDFYGWNRVLLKASNYHMVDSASWRQLFKPEPGSRSYVWSGPTREFYSKAFAQVMEKISAGEWKKAVPVSFARAKGTIEMQDKTAILAQLSSAPDTLIPYGYWKGGVGMIGLTPEILFSRSKNKLSTMALAGTEKKNGPSTLLQDKKNLKEHQFVVQELSEKLSQLGSLEVKGPQVLELPTLYHLLTQFQVLLKEESSWSDLESVDYLHPTSALGISPQKKWKDLKALPEQSERNYFGSPLLFKLSVDESLALVALRQIQWNPQEVLIGAGGGVVQESQEELEWLEILAKIDSVKKLLGIS